MNLLAVQWLPKRKKFPHGLIQETGFRSFDSALSFAKGDGRAANAKSCIILRGSTEGINAGKLFLDFIVR